VISPELEHGTTRVAEKVFARLEGCSRPLVQLAEPDVPHSVIRKRQGSNCHVFAVHLGESGRHSEQLKAQARDRMAREGDGVLGIVNKTDVILVCRAGILAAGATRLGENRAIIPDDLPVIEQTRVGRTQTTS
jgi:hypothetical protein